MRHFARAEFEQHKHITDLVRPLYIFTARNQLTISIQGHIRYLISTGKTQFDTMKNSLIHSGILVP